MTFRPIILVLCFLALFVSGCKMKVNIIKVKIRGVTSYYKNSKKECGESFCNEGSALGSTSDSCIIKLANGKEVKAYLEGLGKSVVYIWAPYCHGKLCLPINLIRQKCESENLKLVVVMEDYDCRLVALSFDKNHPVIGIDTRYYKTDFTDGYRRKFLFDLTGIKGIDMSAGRFFFFENGKYISEQETL